MQFNTTGLEIEQRLNSRLPNTISIERLEQYISLFQYPCGTIPMGLYFNQSPLYTSKTLDENYEYFNTFFNYLKPYYTEDEYNIILTHAVLSYMSTIVIPADWRDRIKNLTLQTNTEFKTEIQYLWDEILYIYTRSLIYNMSTATDPSIETNLTYLSSVEDEHNNFNIEVQLQ